MKNILKTKLEQGGKPIGTFLTQGAYTAEFAAYGLLDYFVLDNEHGPGDAESAVPAIVMAERYGITPLVRVKDFSRTSVLKMLDNGAMGLVVPFIQSVEDVKTLIGYAKYAPMGARGFGGVRASGYGFAAHAQDTQAYFETCNRETLLLPQCETRGCLNHIEEIAALDGVSGIFVGPYDLSVALGVAGDMGNKALLDAIARIQAVCAAAGKYSFIYAGAADAASRYFDMGYSSVACGTDASLLIGAFRSMATKIRR